jgi:hypothetical protein
MTRQNETRPRRLLLNDSPPSTPSVNFQNRFKSFFLTKKKKPSATFTALHDLRVLNTSKNQSNPKNRNVPVEPLVVSLDTPMTSRHLLLFPNVPQTPAKVE